MYGERHIELEDGTKLYEGMYRVRKHGLQFIVEELYLEFNPVFITDSTWTNEALANEHCKILNDEEVLKRVKQ